MIAEESEEGQSLSMMEIGQPVAIGEYQNVDTSAQVGQEKEDV